MNDRARPPRSGIPNRRSPFTVFRVQRMSDEVAPPSPCLVPAGDVASLSDPQASITIDAGRQHAARASAQSGLALHLGQFSTDPVVLGVVARPLCVPISRRARVASTTTRPSSTPCAYWAPRRGFDLEGGWVDGAVTPTSGRPPVARRRHIRTRLARRAARSRPLAIPCSRPNLLPRAALPTSSWRCRRAASGPLADVRGSMDVRRRKRRRKRWFRRRRGYSVCFSPTLRVSGANKPERSGSPSFDPMLRTHRRKDDRVRVRHGACRARQIFRVRWRRV